MRRHWTRLGGGLALWLVAASAAADPQDLRARLEAARDKHAELPGSVFTSIAHQIDVAERIARGFPVQAQAWRARAQRSLEQAERGVDPFPLERGNIVNRGYRSPISTRIQGYSIYLPPGYTPAKTWPLMVVLHGGSSNGNLFLGVVLGNNMNWKEYDQHLWDVYEPRWTPDWIVVAPDGYGQVMWRYMGEQDVLDVIDEVTRNYAVDRGRVVLAGLSNGGVGAYSIGSRHAHRFSVVQAMAGAPSWIAYAGQHSVSEPERPLLQALSAMDLCGNWFNTDFRYYHGTVDPGPMRPAYVHALDAHLDSLGVPHQGKWFETGHDLLYLVQRHGKVYPELAEVRRQARPREVHLVTGDYRAARQHWLEITRFQTYPQLAEVVGKVHGESVALTTRNVQALALDLRTLPETGEHVRLSVDGQALAALPRSAYGHRLHLIRNAGGQFEPGLPQAGALEKRPGLSGPITDAYFGRMVHVYGTQNEAHREALRSAAKTGARGWPLWLWTVAQEVVADVDVDEELMRRAHLVLYGTPGDNRVLERLRDRLPIRVEGDAVVAGDKRYTGKGVGTRFVYPNPEAPERYVIVMAAPTVEGVQRGHRLPDFVPDFVIYDARSTARRPRLVPNRAPLARGFFDRQWKLPAP